MDLNLILVGLGYWGPNLLRTFNDLGTIRSAYDLDEKKVEKFKSMSVYRDIHFGTNWEEIVPVMYDGIVIATPPNTHFDIAMKAMKMGLSVFIEKPMTLVVEEAEILVEEARKRDLVILVGHIFLYSPEIVKLKQIINSEDFGDVHYIYTQRLNLGKIQAPANVVEDLAPHDVSILNYLLDDICEEVLATGQSHVINGIEDVAFVDMKYKNGVTAHLHLSWLDPLKIRNTVVVGTKQMAVCDSGNKKIDVYNKGVDIDQRQHFSNTSYAGHLLSYKYGDVISPYIEGVEPMKAEAADFLDCLEVKREELAALRQPLASGDLGVEVVKTLAAMQRSLRGGQVWEKV
jgi:predicted dehydrogenase